MTSDSLCGILRAELNFSLSCDFSGGTIVRKDKEKFRSARKIPPSGKQALFTDAELRAILNAHRVRFFYDLT
jgi:hypothetical protein